MILSSSSFIHHLVPRSTGQFKFKQPKLCCRRREHEKHAVFHHLNHPKMQLKTTELKFGDPSGNLTCLDSNRENRSIPSEEQHVHPIFAGFEQAAAGPRCSSSSCVATDSARHCQASGVKHLLEKAIFHEIFSGDQQEWGYNLL